MSPKHTTPNGVHTTHYFAVIQQTNDLKQSTIGVYREEVDAILCARKHARNKDITTLTYVSHIVKRVKNDIITYKVKDIRVIEI